MIYNFINDVSHNNKQIAGHIKDSPQEGLIKLTSSDILNVRHFVESRDPHEHSNIYSPP
jgi:hypothetical protein